MAWAWNDPISDGFDWSQIDILLKFDKAVWERRQAQESSSPGRGSAPVGDAWVPWQTNAAPILLYTPPVLAADTEVQIFYLIYTWQRQLFGPDGSSGFVLNTIDPTSFDPTTSSPADIIAPNVLDIPTALALAGYTGQTQLRRKCPRQVASPTSTLDTENNTAAAGQKAQVKSLGGVIRIHDGSGWNIVPPGAPGDLLPDTLDTTLATPFKAQVDANPPLGIGPLPGGIQPDDYIGVWLFQQLRDVMNLMKKIAYTPPIGIPGAVIWPNTEEYIIDSNPVSPVSDSWANAQADVASHWPGTNVGPGTDTTSSLFQFSDGSYDPGGPSWAAEAHTGSAEFIQYSTTITGRNSIVEVYVGAQSLGGPDDVFDSQQATGLTDSAYFLAWMDGPGNAATKTSPTWPPNPTTLPAWCADPSGTGSHSSSLGFNVDASRVIAIVEWDFEFQ